MIELNQEQSPPIPNEILLRVIQMNELIARQNGLIIQALTLPAMIVKERQDL
jgi:hypothetical protein